MPAGSDEAQHNPPVLRRVRPTRVVVQPAGPMMVEGPVEITVVGGDGPVVVERFLVAVCACRASRVFPLCDGSHRRIAARDGAAGRDSGGRDSGEGPAQ